LERGDRKKAKYRLICVAVDSTTLRYSYRGIRYCMSNSREGVAFCGEG
jgi:hypothetical protein